MIDQVDQLLKEWAEEVVPNAEIRLFPPCAPGENEIVGLYLIDLLPLAPASDSRKFSKQISLRYLVTTCASSPEDAHRMLGDLAFAAMEDSRFEVELAPLPAQAWNAFNVVPQPSFMLLCPLRQERAEPEIPYISRPIDVKKVPMAGLDGIVMGPENIPLANARIELRDHQLATRTDCKGRFQFSVVPVQPSVKQFCIEVRGRKMLVEVEHRAEEKRPLIIHFDATEV